MQQTLKQKHIQQEIDRLKQQFLQSADFTAKEIAWGPSEQAIICYYSSLVKKSEVERYLNLLRLEHKRALRAQSNETQRSFSNQEEGQTTSNQNNNHSKQLPQDEKANSTETDLNHKMVDQTKLNPNKNNYSSNQVEQVTQTTVLPEDSISITTEKYDRQKIVEHICNGETLIILYQRKEMIRLMSPEFVHRPTEEPANEQVLRGSHEGLIEHFDSNVSLIRKRLKNNKLVVKKVVIGKETKTEAYYFYVDSLVDKEALKTVEERLNSINLDMYYSLGQLSDQLDDSVMSPFPQLLNTERPDRVVANILEGKIAVMTDNSPTAIIGPVTFFSFYQSPDDFNSRVLIGTFYRIVRSFSLVMAIYLPAVYISIVSFHSEVLPIELANKVKLDINQIPYRPFIEALIMAFTLELIREASVRLPKSIGQTVGIVGGLVIGDAIVKAGLVSNLMVIVVAFTAIASFVIPSIELNTTIRVIGFPIMILASFFGFFGIMIGTFILIIHLMNLSSFNQPYLSPIIPFDPKEFKKVFIRMPYYKANSQVTSFSPKKGEKA